ncbi:hypothetical protein CC80DRAFT_21350 [Byssothecium circinans]|uniref:Uncharacterized protein n=1 Tax=Byssothecium circinans TaxID=147558 RepID=A0A6A5U117_9PLEO|nr:hypothetical protein CC80DRAFT_21350 [Byssothecium circinans]
MNVGALTTTFTPAAGCNSTIYGSILTRGSTTHKYHSLGHTKTQWCYPPLYNEGVDAYYSPGICPQQWTTAFQDFETKTSGIETRVNCCPM